MLSPSRLDLDPSGPRPAALSTVAHYEKTYRAPQRTNPKALHVCSVGSVSTRHAVVCVFLAFIKITISPLTVPRAVTMSLVLSWLI